MPYYKQWSAFQSLLKQLVEFVYLVTDYIPYIWRYATTPINSDHLVTSIHILRRGAQKAILRKKYRLPQHINTLQRACESISQGLCIVNRLWNCLNGSAWLA
jgi:hypothetical protein